MNTVQSTNSTKYWRCLHLMIPTLLFIVSTTTVNSAPNILFILADDLGWEDIGLRNDNEIKTPNIDSIYSNGISLENYYVQPTCSPTRATLLTGMEALQKQMLFVEN